MPSRVSQVVSSDRRRAAPVSSTADQPVLPIEAPRPATLTLAVASGPRALEDDAFPFEALSTIAELESWRKEIHRPLYHIHKWWATRLGAVVRAMLLGALAPRGTNILDLFYQPVRIPHAVVFDPFMGAGTTIGETAKLGARAIGRDINSVSYFLVRNALGAHDRPAITAEFRAIEHDVGDRIRRFYRTALPNGQDVDVLYFFWVKTVGCPTCHKQVDLFSSYVFARHAYPKKRPLARAVCPHCDAIVRVRYDSSEARCLCCAQTFDPRNGTVTGQKATCRSCSSSFVIAKTVREGSQPPSHRLYAKLVLMPDGAKEYMSVTEEDRRLYATAETALARRQQAFPCVPIEPGYNTNQALGYNYHYWHQMFNARQLLCLSLLASRIARVQDTAVRELFTCLFSGMLEFNNLFTSYKGEGTGAVRHMFAHHIIKPERVPLEANVWGTPKSSGAFSTLFASRIMRALDNAHAPFELRAGKRKAPGAKVFGLSDQIGCALADDYKNFVGGNRVYISCGDSSETDVAAGSVDAVVTDPPFFDNVHYSELADFFYVWQRHILGAHGHRQPHTTRSGREVQSADADTFTKRLAAVLAEARRVLKDDGILAFTYHHSRAEGWRAVLAAVMGAGFDITAAQPVKAEMSVAMPKHQARAPINLDIIVVCRKRLGRGGRAPRGELWDTVRHAANDQVGRLRAAGRRLSRNDVRVIFMGQLIRRLSAMRTVEGALGLLESCREEVEVRISELHDEGQRGRVEET